MKTFKFFLSFAMCLAFSSYGFTQTVYPNGLVVYSGTSAYGAYIAGGNLYVDASQCIGQDCDTFTTFGFSTTILKENNTRLTFDDTSNPDFPDRDWELVANESDQFGREEFRIDDLTAATRPFRITGGAPSNSLVTGANGFLGVGALNPAVALHLVYGDTPSLRLEDNGPSPYTWDVIGNEANFALRDVSGGGTLTMQIRPSAPAQSFYIENNGNVGIGTPAPTEKLEVNGNTIINGDLTLIGQVMAPSDARLKTGILPISNALALLAPLQVKTYHYRHQEFSAFNLPHGQRYGLIAQEVQKHLPELVSEFQMGTPENGKFNHLDYLGMVPILVKALQELDVLNQALIEQNDTLHEALEARQHQIDQMKKEIAEMHRQVADLLSSTEK